MPYFLASITFIIFGLVLRYWRRSRGSIAHLPGPPAHSWLVGNLPSFQRAENAADADFEWTQQYGNAFRLKGCFGEDVLYLSDPKALQYILNKSGYNFPKSWEIRSRTTLTTGLGIVSAEGVTHARHRRVMNPSFSHSALKEYLPLFVQLSRRTVGLWKATILRQDTEAPVIDVSSLLTRTTLDIIGEAAFGYKFKSIEAAEPQTDLHKAYQNLFVDTDYMPSDFDIAFRRIQAYAPLWITGLLTFLPRKDLQRLKHYMSVARNVAKDLVGSQTNAQSNKEGRRDVMSILVKANNSEDPKRRLEEEEILAQITTLLLAGHETTANSLGWTLYELSKHPEVQNKLRHKVKAVLVDVASRADPEITVSDLDSMKYMVAILKETLRYHPIVLQLSRRAGADDVIPLDNPQRTVSGDVIWDIPVRKGQVVQLGLASYNRLNSVWGDDADQWRPERFLEEHHQSQSTTLGVFENLSTFGSGLRSCIGWRFSLIEMQAVLIELVDAFEFSPAPGVEIRRATTGIMQSMVRGQEDKGIQMPLAVTILSNHGD